jgi:hypothetical protein
VIRPWLLWATAAVLAGLLGLGLWHPDAWLAPGQVSPGHAALADDCLACHTPWRGATDARCTACHRPAEIGVRTVAGQRLPARAAHVPFHQQLARPDCMACHGGHSGATGVQFEHGLLAPQSRGDCAACHAAPADDLHRAIAGRCGDCHATTAWKPATFDHEKLFALDGDHRVACVTCHGTGNFSSYSCTGCHAHSPGRLRAEHAEEGIRASADCVRCHRSTREHGEGGEGRGGEGRGDD